MKCYNIKLTITLMSFALPMYCIAHKQTWTEALGSRIRNGTTWVTNKCIKKKKVSCTAGTLPAGFGVFNKSKKKQSKDNKVKKIPIVYSDNYDVRFYGIEKLHPFDTAKYSKVFNYLSKQMGINKKQLHKPDEISEQELLKVHTKRYLDSLKSSSVVARIAEIYPLAWVPNFLLQRKLLRPMRYATKGTHLATQLAEKYGWAINLSGGYHHAKHDSSGGFCYYGDIQLAAKQVLATHPDWNLLVVDLDAHQGNGHADGLKNEQRAFIFDIYNEQIYPYDTQAKAYIDFNHPVQSGIEDKAYLSLLKQKLPKAIDKIKPNFIIYNAGTDIYEKDPLGAMRISAEGIKERDKVVFELAKQHNIPIVMILSGGYTKESAAIIGQSIENIIRKLKLLDDIEIDTDQTVVQ